MSSTNDQYDKPPKLSAEVLANDPHAVSIEEANGYYADFCAYPTLLYRTGAEKWTPPPEEHFEKTWKFGLADSPLDKAWRVGLSTESVKALSAHKVTLLSHIPPDSLANVNVKQVYWDDIAITRFRTSMEDTSPLTLSIAVIPKSTTPTAAHNAAMDINSLLLKYGITETVNIEFAVYDPDRPKPKWKQEQEEEDRIANTPLARLIKSLGPLAEEFTTEELEETIKQTEEKQAAEDRILAKKSSRRPVKKARGRRA